MDSIYCSKMRIQISDLVEKKKQKIYISFFDFFV